MHKLALIPHRMGVTTEEGGSIAGRHTRKHMYKGHKKVGSKRDRVKNSNCEFKKGIKCLCGSNSYSEELRSTSTTGCIKRLPLQFKFDAGNNDCLHIYSWLCPLINEQNIKDDKRNLRLWKLINPQETPAWLHHVSISHPQKKKGLLPPCTFLSFYLHFGQINYLASIKGEIVFHPPSYANEWTQWWDRKLVHQMVLA